MKLASIQDVLRKHYESGFVHEAMQGESLLEMYAALTLLASYVRENMSEVEKDQSTAALIKTAMREGKA